MSRLLFALYSGTNRAQLLLDSFLAIRWRGRYRALQNCQDVGLAVGGFRIIAYSLP